MTGGYVSLDILKEHKDLLPCILSISCQIDYLREEPFIHTPGLRIMVYATGSAVDRQVGPGVRPLLETKYTNAAAII